MVVEWTEHRFAGGALALDVANTVVLRIDPERRFDRFDDAAELRRFAKAAMVHRAEELTEKILRVEQPDLERKRLIQLREAIDSLFRESAGSKRLSTTKLPALLVACARSIRAMQPGDAMPGNVLLDAATALSAIDMLAPDRVARIRICGNCGWLFLDRSRNGSRRWCDMAVCGNRSKARRHYEKMRTDAQQ